MKKIIRFLCVSLFSIVLFGCASNGNDFDEKGLAQFEIGVTTVQDATILLKSKPVQVINNSKGQWVAWRYVTANGFTMRSEVKEALIVFDNDGKFVRIHQLQNIDTNGIDLKGFQ